MSQQSNLKLIGVFVLGAVALFVGAVVVFGSGKFFKDTLTFVAYFDGSVKGLSIGAPLAFRGVKVGSVKEIDLAIRKEDQQLFIPVLLEFERGHIRQIGETTTVLPSRGEAMQRMESMVKQGLRAQLALDSFVTGQLYVSLDFFPESPLVLRDVEKEYRELPTIPSGLEQLKGRLEQIPIDEIAKGLRGLIAKVDTLVSSPDVGDSIKRLNETLKDGEKLMEDLDKELVPLINKINQHVDGVSGDTREALQTANKAMTRADSVLTQGSPLIDKLDTALTEFAAASRSVRLLADYIERHPEAFLVGKSDKGGK